MVVLIIFPVILQTVINVIMLSIGEQGGTTVKPDTEKQQHVVQYMTQIHSDNEEFKS